LGGKRMSVLGEFANSAINVILLLLFLVPLVVIHEFGHFILARRAKVRVHEFGIGFPPRARVLGRDKQGTEYTLNWLPIGGFVRLEGEEGESDDPRAFVNQRLRTRLLILVAGVAMNFLLAFVIFAGIALLADPVSNVRIAAIDPGSPAASVGLKGGNVTGTTTDASGKVVPVYDETGDVITAVDGRVFPIFDQVDTQTPSLTYLRAHAGQTVTLTVQHADGTIVDIPVTLRVPGPGQGPLGILVHPKLVPAEVHHDPITSIGKGLARTVDASTLILRGLGGLIANVGNPPVSGPVGIVNAIGTVRQQLPPVFLIWLIGLLSANLAVINALPFPPLDGGRAAVAVIQSLSNNRIGQAAERLVYLTGFVLLMALLVWLTLFDTGILQRQSL
jgi:regulator of sigma E protease